MNFGRRQIGCQAPDDGSAQIDLPEGLAALAGLACWVETRHRPHPELVFRVDVQSVMGPVLALWRGLRLGLSMAVDIGVPPLADFSFRPEAASDAMPPAGPAPLLCADLLALDRAWSAAKGEPTRSEAATAAAHTLDAVGQTAGRRAGLGEPWAGGFGAALSCLMIGLSCVRGGVDFERSHVAHGFAHCLPLTTPERLNDDAVWAGARPHLYRLLEQFQAWQAAPADYARLRAVWARATGLAAISPAAVGTGRQPAHRMSA